MSASFEPREPCGLSYVQLSRLGDDQVMAHLAAGHGDALAVLLDRFSRLVHSIAFRVLRDASEAEDVAQEVFLELCRTAARFDPAKGTTKMWVVRSAYRRGLNRRRYLSLRKVESISDNGEVPWLASAVERWIAPKLTAYESQRLIRQMLGRLDPVQRRVLELVFFDGLTMREVAAQTGTTLESVRHRYYRGIDKLRHVMEEGFAREALPRAKEAPDAGT
jgi:RNA polymerase sigma-70 factor, ECF subfamily